MKVFVYGTLRKNELNHLYLQNSTCIAEQAWTCGEIYDTGLGYPAMQLNESDKVYGELYEVDQDTLDKIDVLEGYILHNKDSLFERVVTVVHTDVERIDAFVYIARPNVRKVSKITHGDWKLYRLIQSNKKQVYYFAYGSCMDTERFHLAGVNDYFSHVEGSAILSGYSMKYLFHANDGGRADIIEDGGTVEGILYNIPYAGVEYLFKREGFYGGWYRPTFISCTIKDHIYTDVLTFHVYDKKEEIAPPNHYSTEILRGAKGRVSGDYYRKLEEDLFKLNALNI